MVYPNGKTETLFKGKWDFNWQLGYDFAAPVDLPEGTRLIGISHFDNSADNLANPDPTAEVGWGEQTWEEMLNGFLEVAIDPNIPTPKVFGPVPAEAAQAMEGLTNSMNLISKSSSQVAATSSVYAPEVTFISGQFCLTIKPAMSFFIMGPLLGPVLGPLTGGSHDARWRNGTGVAFSRPSSRLFAPQAER